MLFLQMHVPNSNIDQNATAKLGLPDLFINHSRLPLPPCSVKVKANFVKCNDSKACDIGNKIRQCRCHQSCSRLACARLHENTVGACA